MKTYEGVMHKMELSGKLDAPAALHSEKCAPPRYTLDGVEKNLLFLPEMKPK
jgi:hypothetical protein